jgi:hypothetical protein
MNPLLDKDVPEGRLPAINEYVTLIAGLTGLAINNTDISVLALKLPNSDAVIHIGFAILMCA